MKEYTYTNKAYLGIKEGIVPPAPQYLWLNSKDDKLYKFGDNGWEVTNNASYIGEEFTVQDIITKATEDVSQLTISRALLDAMYKGLPIMVKSYSGNSVLIPIDVDSIDDPSKRTAFQFRVKEGNTEYVVIFRSAEIISGNKDLAVRVNSYNSVDWNENNNINTGYIANRTHHLGSMIGPTDIGNRVSLIGTKGTHYFSDYKVLYNGKFYDLPPLKQGQPFDIADYFRLRFTGYRETGNTSTYIFESEQISQTLPFQTFEIYRTHEGSGHKTLDELYLPDEAKPWKIIDAIPQMENERAYHFENISISNIASGDNVIRNKVIYQVTDANSISIGTPLSDSILEFKIIVVGSHQFSIDGKVLWENGERPDASSETSIIYSFLVVNGMYYISAKVYGNVK